MTTIHPSNRRLFAKWAAWYWLRSVPNYALWWIWKHYGESANAGQEPKGEAQRPTQMSGSRKSSGDGSGKQTPSQLSLF